MRNNIFRRQTFARGVLSSSNFNACPVPGISDRIRIFYFFGQDLLEFVTSDHTAFQYTPFIRNVTGVRKDRHDSRQFFIAVFRLFAPHAPSPSTSYSFALAAEGITVIPKTYLALTKEIETVRASGNGETLPEFLPTLVSSRPSRFSLRRNHRR
jgi:hypothetical protein